MPSWTFLGLQGPIKGPIFGICVTVFIIIAFVLFGMMKKQKYEARFLKEKQANEEKRSE